MKRELLAGAVAIALMAGTPALAQSVAVEISPAQRTQIKQYVVKEKVKPFVYNERISVGTTLPGEVELVAIPQSWGPSLTKYRYVYSNDHVVLVEPSSRKVIHIIE